MVIDNNVIRQLAVELNDKAKEARIDRVYIENSFVYLKLRGYKGNFCLFLSANTGLPALFLSDKFKSETVTPSAFSMLFRKHFLSGKIVEIKQLNNDRIVEISVLSSDDLGDKSIKKIILELTGRNSNLILADENNKIFGALRQIGISENTKRVILAGTAYTLPDNQNPKEFIEVDNANERVREYFESRVDESRRKSLISPLLKIANNNLKRAEKKIKKLQVELEIAKNREYYRINGELLTANLHSLKQAKSAEVFNYYENTNIIIELDDKISVSKNAERFYKKYTKLKTAEKELANQIEACQQDIVYWESVVHEIEFSDDLSEIKEELGIITKKDKKPAKKVQPFYKDEICEIYVGKNNNQNDFLTTKFANKKDLWFHTQNIPSSHVILKCENITDELVLKAARITAEHSKAKDSSKVVVDYCPIKNVKKPRNAKAGFVVYNDYKTIIVNLN